MIQNSNIKKPDYIYCGHCGRVLYPGKIGERNSVKTMAKQDLDVKVFSIRCACGTVKYFHSVDTV